VSPRAYITGRPVPLVLRPDFSRLIELAEATFVAADGDSNDEEIEALQDFRDVALEVLGIEVTETD